MKINAALAASVDAKSAGAGAIHTDRERCEDWSTTKAKLNNHHDHRGPGGEQIIVLCALNNPSCSS
jgi:hypothetical protein